MTRTLTFKSALLCSALAVTVACGQKQGPGLLSNNGNNNGDNNGENNGTVANNGANNGTSGTNNGGTVAPNNGANNGANNGLEVDPIPVDSGKNYQGTPPAFQPNGSVEEFGFQLVTAVCQRSFECLNNGNLLNWLSVRGAATVGECTQAQLNRQHPSLLQAAVDSGRSNFDISGVVACITEIAMTSCDEMADVANDPFAYLSECQAVLASDVEPVSCEGSWECPTDTFCYKPEDGNCLGACTPTNFLFPLCGETNCQLDEQCDFETNTCGPRLGDGGTCDHGGECLQTYDCVDSTCKAIRRGEAGGGCGDEWACDIGLGCRSGVCEERPGPGEACVQYACPTGYFCGADCTAQNEGGSCTSDEVCLSGECHQGTCRPPTTSCHDL